MNRDDERILDAIVQSFARAGIDARNLAVDVIGGAVLVRGSVQTRAERVLLGQLISAAMPDLAWRIAVGVRPAVPEASPGSSSRPATHPAYESGNPLGQ